MRYELAIPSYKRSATIVKRTLAFLASVQFPADKITIFIVEEDYQDYLKIPLTLYGKLVIGVKGLMEQRNFITRYYPDGTPLICMDDDVQKIDSRKTFQEILEMASVAIAQGGLFGVMPNDDKRRYKDATTTHLTHILGSFFVMKNDQKIVITHCDKEDYERSILFFKKYGKVYRYQGAGVRTSYAKTAGGLQTEGRALRMACEAERLVRMYPELCKRKDKKGMADILLNWKAVSQK